MSELLETVVHSPGHALVSACDTSYLDIFVDELLGRISLTSDVATLEDLRKVLPTLSNKDINRVMVSLLNFSNGAELVANAFKSTIVSFCGHELFLQRRANLIMNLPGENQRHQWPHYEFMSGISPYTFILWVPLHVVGPGEGGVYFLSADESHRIMLEEQRQGLVNGPKMFDLSFPDYPLNLIYSNGLIFNSFVIHGNQQFTGDKARLAVSIRFQSRSFPLMQRNSDFLTVCDLY